MRIMLPLILLAFAAEVASEVVAADHGSPVVDFDTQVMPILTKAGCNAGACHGAAAGRGGFSLSLYGSRPQRDFEEIKLALEGRRINHRQPVDSLLLMKPTEQVSHEGGTRLDSDGPDFALLTQWIAGGAQRFSGSGRRRLETFLLQPAATQLSVGQVTQLSATATFSDGAEQDVLAWTIFNPDDPSAVEITNAGRLTIHRCGRHVVVARYLNQVVALEFLVPETSVAGRTAAPTVANTNSIDSFIDARLQKLGFVAVSDATTTELTRRLSIDLTGRLPSRDQVEQFRNDASLSESVDRLLQSEAFIDCWTYHLAELFRVADMRNNPAAARAYFSWLRKCVAGDVSFRELAWQLITAEGAVAEYGPASFYAVVSDPRSQAEFFSTALLGVRMQCANCHDHPLDAWTQDDYHGLAAIFARIQRGAVIRSTTSGQVIHPATGAAAVARIPGVDRLLDDAHSRVALADWLTSDQNPYFAKAIVNRIWSRLMGRGLVEPVDDLRTTNPATHPELLNWLAADFVEHGDSIRHTVRRICLSSAYRRSSRAASVNSTADRFYAIATLKPLTPAVFLDAVCDVTDVPSILADSNARAVSLVGLIEKSEALDLLGRCRAVDCSPASSGPDELTVQLHLLNGQLLNARLRDPEGALMRAVAAKKSWPDLVSEFYLRSYSRHPSAAENEFWGRQFSAVTNSAETTAVAEDFLWSLLSSEEFRTNR